MNKDTLIANQQIQIEEFKLAIKENEETLRIINYRFTGIGQPLNDNILKMNNSQLAWVFEIKELVDQLRR